VFQLLIALLRSCVPFAFGLESAVMLKRTAVPIALLIALAATVACSKQPAPDNTSANQPNATSPSGSTGGAAPSSAKKTAPKPEAPKAEPVVLPAGTIIYVRLNNTVGSKVSHDGDPFTATVEDDVQVNGKTAIPKGANAFGVVSEAKPLGRFKGGALLRLALESVEVNGAKYPVRATLSRSQKGKGKRSAVTIGGGAGLGAIIGAVAGGGKGAAIGAAAGAGAGTAGAAFTGNKEITIPAESSVGFELREATTLKKE
jgi:hypothetical protein